MNPTERNLIYNSMGGMCWCIYALADKSDESEKKKNFQIEDKKDFLSKLIILFLFSLESFPVIAGWGD